MGVDGLPILSTIQFAITTWAKSSTQDVVLYLVGNGGNGTFKVNKTENLSGSDLDSWLDSLQSSISAGWGTLFTNYTKYVIRGKIK